MSTLRLLAHSLIKENLETNCPNIPQSANVGKLISLLQTSENYEAIVTNGHPPRLVTVRDILKVTHPERTSVSRIAFNPPSIIPDTPVYEASQKLIHSRVRILSVVENESIVGVVRQTKILEKMADCEDLEECTAEKLMVENPLTVEQEFSIGVIRDIMLRNGISHTPVVDKDGKLKGMITAKDLVWNFIKPSESQTVGERKGENIRIWDMSMKGMIDTYPLYVTRRTSILDVISEMSTLKKGYCLVVEKQKPIGIITPRDILSLLTQFEPKIAIPVYVVGFKDFDKDLVQSALRKIDRTARRGLTFHPDLQEIIVDGRVKARKGEKRRFEIKARAYMPSNMISVKVEGWSLLTLFDEVNEKLDAALRQIKGKWKTERSGSR
jgi:CBS domain-containing protein/ribosome-associated translation inhibitor RaiA